MALALVLAVLLTPGPGLARALGQQAEAETLKIEVLEGEGSINNIRELTMRSPSVRVLDANGSPVFGATVTFTTPAMGASAIFMDGSNQASFVTNERGVVRVEGMRPNNVVGNFEIRVLANRGRDRASARIGQTNAAPSTGGGGGGGSNRGLLILLIVAGAGAGVAAALGGGGSSSGSPSTPPGNGGPTPNPPVTISPGTPGFSAP